MKRILMYATLLSFLILGGRTALSQSAVDTQAPVINYSVPDYTVVRPNSFAIVQVPIYVTDNVSLRMVQFAGPSVSTYGIYPLGTLWMKGNLYWSTKGRANGDYTFTCTAIDWKGNKSVKKLVLRLQK